MKRAFVLSLAAASGTAALAISAGASAADSSASGTAAATGANTTNGVSWYVSPMLQYSLQGNDPQLKDNFGYQAGIGVNLPHEWALEGDFSRSQFDIKGYDATRRQTGYSIDIIKKIFPQNIMQRYFLQPYVLAGGGEMDDRTSAPGFDSGTFHTFLAEAGIGLLTGIGSQEGPTRVQLRTEAKYRLEFANPSMFGVKDPSGVMFGVGLQMSFGHPDERPPVIKTVEKEVVREVVREVPAPTPPPLPPPPKGDIRLQGVTFATNSSELNPESDTVLDTTIASLKQYPNLVLEVRGYADSRGSAAYNLKLTQRRAESVMQYLKSHGLTNQLSAKGFGKEDPIADNSTKDGQLANRRVTLHIVGGDGS